MLEVSSSLTADFLTALPASALEHVHEHVGEGVLLGVDLGRLDRLDLVELAILELAVELLKVDCGHPRRTRSYGKLVWQTDE